MSLFPASKIPADVPLPSGYKLRPLATTDYDSGFLTVLSGLTTVGDISKQAWEERYDFMASRPGEYFVVVIEDDKGKIVGVGTVLVEFKFIRNLGKVGHIEDIAVLEDQRGKNLGKTIIAVLDEIAKGAGCYKTILDCSEKNEGFYVKCGHKKAGVQMAHYF